MVARAVDVAAAERAVVQHVVGRALRVDAVAPCFRLARLGCIGVAALVALGPHLLVPRAAWFSMVQRGSAEVSMDQRMGQHVRTCLSLVQHAPFGLASHGLLGTKHDPESPILDCMLSWEHRDSLPAYRMVLSFDTDGYLTNQA